MNGIAFCRLGFIRRSRTYLNSEKLRNYIQSIPFLIDRCTTNSRNAFKIISKQFFWSIKGRIDSIELRENGESIKIIDPSHCKIMN